MHMDISQEQFRDQRTYPDPTPAVTPTVKKTLSVDTLFGETMNQKNQQSNDSIN